jgi:hypothetical protein
VRPLLTVSDFLKLSILTPFLILAALRVKLSSPAGLLASMTVFSRRGKPGKPFKTRHFRWIELLEKLDRRLFRSPSCLRRSLVLIRLTDLLGYSADLKIGFKKNTSSAPAAHAWVEINGIALETPPEEKFLQLES